MVPDLAGFVARTRSAALIAAVVFSPGSQACGTNRAAGADRPFVFGVNASAERADFEVAKAAGCTCVRIGCGWDLVEPEEGKLDWREPDQAVDLCREFGFEPFFLIVATPKWALSADKRDKPWGWAAEPEFYPQAERFYRALAERYRGKVRYYEFWNEPNGYGWHEPNHPEEYAPILKLAYRSLKEGDPNCLVAVGGLDGGGWKGYYKYLEKLYELGCGKSFDAVAVHPYRRDGPIDVHGLRKIREVLVKHGDANKKLWLTEYGWSNEYGHDNKAKWLKESLDLLTSPELDYVFQASVHTLDDFDRTQYGLCTRGLQPRAAYQVFRDYPKDWNKIAELRKSPPSSDDRLIVQDDFEETQLRWTGFGDSLVARRTGDIGVTAESGKGFAAAANDESPKKGGAWLTLDTEQDAFVRVESRVFTNETCGKPSNSRCRVGIDPSGGKNPGSESVLWSRWIDTSGAWDTIGVGQGHPIAAKCEKITVFLEYTHTGGSCSQVSAFDNVRVIAFRHRYVPPRVQSVKTTSKVYQPAEEPRSR